MSMSTVASRESPIGLDYAKSKGLTLFPYQKSGVALMQELTTHRRLENPNGVGGVLLLDEMGLGKTMEILAYIAKMEPRPEKVLFIVPNTLKGEWRAAIQKWLPPEEVAAFATGRGGLKRFKGLGDDPVWKTAPTRCLITNYETMRSPDYMDILLAFKADVLVFDEAHRLRNWDKKTAVASRKLSADTILMATGTPIVNHAGDLWSLISKVAPTRAGNASSWERTFTYVTPGYRGSKKMGVRNRQSLKELLSSVAVQRKKEEVLKDLPPKLIREVPLEMEDDQRALYEQMENELFIQLDEEGASLQANSVLALMTRLRQLCCDPRTLGKIGSTSVKTDFIKELVEDIGEEQMVIFSNFEQFISFLAEDLQKEGYSFARLTGKEDFEKRSRNIKDFWDGKVQFMLGTTGAGGEGVNLQCAQKIILVDRWWSPVRNDQALDRLHRIGQTGTVEAIIPHCVDTIDDALKEVLSRKYTVINELRIQGDTVELLREWRGRRGK
jgi:SNF2 family DNA or RNA helicase